MIQIQLFNFPFYYFPLSSLSWAKNALIMHVICQSILRLHGLFIQAIYNLKQAMCTGCLEGACCICACCCKDCSQALSKSLGQQKVTKFCYLFLVVIFTIPAILILFFINKWSGFKDYFSWMQCPQSSGGNFECIGPSTVYRISLSFLVLFFIMMVFMLCRNRIAMAINEGLFCVKYLFVLGVFIAFLFIGSGVFDQYAEASKYISILFMVIQSIILIDLFYLAGIKLVKRYDQGEGCYGALLVFLTVICQAVAIGLNVYGYVLFSGSDGCGNSLWVNVITSIILLLLPVFQCCHFNKQNSLLTTSLVSVYIAYLALICQFSYGGGQCTDRMTVRSIAADIVVSTFFFFIAMYGTIMGGSGQIKAGGGDLNQAMGVAPTEANPASGQHLEMPHRQMKKQEKKDEQVAETEQANLEKYSQSWGWVKWHFYMCIASIYIGMLVTNWTSASLTTGTLISNGFGFWVRLVISWLVALIYIWTLLAPKIFPDRDFTVV